MKAMSDINARATQASRLLTRPCRAVVFGRMGNAGARRRGMALMLVVILVALASVMGYSLLASSSMQTQVSSTTLQAASADAVAESGVNVAIYYLQNPTLAPLGVGDTYWKGGGNISLGSTVAGTCDVTVTRIDQITYQIQSVGRSSITDDGQSLSRTINAKIKLTYTPSVSFASGANTSLTIPGRMTVTGNVQIKGNLTLDSDAVVKGDVVADSLPLGTGTYTAYTASTASSPVPTSVPDFKTYTYLGHTYSAVELTYDLASGTTLGPTDTNPAGVYWSSGSRKLAGNVTVNGTLILDSGNLQVNGANNVINPVLGFPGLTINGDIKMTGTNRGLTVNGLVYLGVGISGSGASQTGSKLVINGSLLMYGSSPTIGSGYDGTIKVNYDSSKIVVPGIGSASITPTGVAVLSWN